MKEAEATNGEKLKALVASFNLRCTLTTALKHIEPFGPERTCWDEWADQLKRFQTEAAFPPDPFWSPPPKPKA
ncbi:hypothetical protein LCGC14_0164120 [marine sediment metagenome]|uniref:Uncharacterized protein n=1 Tax=marine sediment metagenome TaxID=412755 RepID=A0A0F9XWL0_9ZZZZ